jgi:galactokinase
MAADTPRVRAERSFTEAFGAAPDLLIQAPGRVNLIGEHTDYNDGFVLPCAIDLGTAVAARARTDAMMETIASDFDGERDSIAVDGPIDHAGGWRDYVRGVAVMLQDEGLSRGADLAVSGNVPKGAGLSSSASLEVAVASTLAHLNGSPSIRRASHSSRSGRRMSLSAARAGSWTSSCRHGRRRAMRC